LRNLNWGDLLGYREALCTALDHQTELKII
jgi:hypothetical protein